MNHPTNLILDGNTLFIDNSSLEEYMKCPRRFLYSRIFKREPIKTKAALTFGGAIHLALKLRYLKCGREPVDAETQARQMYLLAKHWEVKPTEIGDYRTCGLAQQCMQEYNRYYQREPFQVCTRKDLGAIVEEPFAIPLGTIGDVQVMWTGRMDMAVVMDGGLRVFDHKTTSMGGEYVSKDYFLASQFKGYAWALRHLKPKIPVKGAIVNLLVVRKPAKSGKGKGNEFLRVNIPYVDDVLDEWQHNTLSICERIILDIQYSNFADHTTQCLTRYGPCNYFETCTLPPSGREPYLRTGDFADNVWTPFREDELDVKEILAMPFDKIQGEVRAAEPEIDNPLTDIYAQLS